MIAVSSGWVAAHKETLLPESFVEITYAATDPDLQKAATVAATSEEYFSNSSELTDGTDKQSEKYGSLEHGLWGLDGTYSYLTDEVVDPGYVSDVVSGADGSFTDAIPLISINFATVRQEAIPGLTITWSDAYNEWAVDYRVTAYKGSTQIAQTTVKGNTGVTSTVLLGMSEYSRVAIEILKWSHPNHRARCIKVFMGIRTIYTKDDLTGYTHSQSADLLSAVLPKNEISFSLRNEDNRWNLDNPTGVERYLLERQEIKVRYGMRVDGEIEWIKGGTFWLSEWSTPANGLEAMFTARDALEFMGEVYEGIRSGTLYNIAVAAFEQANLPLLDNGDVRYVVSETLRTITTDFAIDTQEYTVAEILQMVAHAGNCVFYQDRDGVVRVEPWNVSYSGYVIGATNSYAHPEAALSKPLKAIAVNYGEDLKAIVQVADRGEVQTIENPLLNTETDALRVGERAREILESRKTISGEYRADVRLDALDPIIVASKYASNAVAITDISYSMSGGGAFHGNYTGRVVSLVLQTDVLYSGEIYAGER